MEMTIDFLEEEQDLPVIGSKVMMLRNPWGIQEGQVKYVVGVNTEYIELTSEPDGEIDFLSDVKNWKREIVLVD